MRSWLAEQRDVNKPKEWIDLFINLFSLSFCFLLCFLLLFTLVTALKSTVAGAAARLVAPPPDLLRPDLLLPDLVLPDVLLPDVPLFSLALPLSLVQAPAEVEKSNRTQ